jgi:hypothetical protein
MRCGLIWIGKLDPSGHTLLFATYLGNSPATATLLSTQVAGIAADPSGNVIVAAHTLAPDLPTAKPVQATPKSTFTSLYVAKLSADGSRLLYATYLGGSAAQSALSLAVDSTGAAYVAGTPVPPTFPPPPLPFMRPLRMPLRTARFSTPPCFPFEFYADVQPIQLDAPIWAVRSRR